MRHARQKLNTAYIGGSLLFAAVLGGLAESWLVFVIAAIVLIALNIHAGDIRP